MSVLVPVRAEEVGQETRLLSYALATAKSRVYVYLTGVGATLVLALFVHRVPELCAHPHPLLPPPRPLLRPAGDQRPHARHAGRAGALLCDRGAAQAHV